MGILTLHEQIAITVMAQLILLAVVGWQTALIVWVIQVVSSFSLGCLIGWFRVREWRKNHG